MEIQPNRLNYHHLHYFWAVATDGQLTRTAKRLRVAPSALSSQIRQLEEALDQPLFHRQGRSLVLTDAGRIALAHAETIFGAGEQLLATLRDGRAQQRQVLRIGAVATLSRNFQRGFLAPTLDDPDVALSMVSGTLAELLQRLRAHGLDLVLTNRRVTEDGETSWRCVEVARQPVSLVGPPRERPFRFPDDLEGVSLIVPGRDSEVRSAFDRLCELHGLRVNVAAEVDDMAMLRLLARDSRSAAVVPAVVVVDELREGRLQEYAVLPDIVETFYAVSVPRLLPHPWVDRLVAQRAASVLAVG